MSLPSSVDLNTLLSAAPIADRPALPRSSPRAGSGTKASGRAAPPTLDRTDVERLVLDRAGDLRAELSEALLSEVRLEIARMRLSSGPPGALVGSLGLGLQGSSRIPGSGRWWLVLQPWLVVLAGRWLQPCSGRSGCVRFLRLAGAGPFAYFRPCGWVGWPAGGFRRSGEIWLRVSRVRASRPGGPGS